MSRPPFVEPATAAAMLALADYAAGREPAAPFAFLRGWLARASGEPAPRPDPRSEPGEGNGAPLARVNLASRPPPGR
jgi:hypothetical protein